MYVYIYIYIYTCLYDVAVCYSISLNLKPLETTYETIIYYAMPFENANLQSCNNQDSDSVHTRHLGLRNRARLYKPSPPSWSVPLNLSRGEKARRLPAALRFRELRLVIHIMHHRRM